jgi:aminopeptidase
VIDKRLKILANILINYSLKIKKDDLFLIQGGTVAAPLIKEVYKQAIKIGAHPYTQVGIDGLSEIYYKYSNENQLRFLSPITKFEIKNIDVKLSIISLNNTRCLSGINPKKQAIAGETHKPISDLFLKRAALKELRWCVTQFPTNAAAQDAEMSLDDYENFIFKAAHVNDKKPVNHWKNVFLKQEKIKEKLESKNKIRIIAEDTDLEFSVKGRQWINCAGKENFPDGEIFTGPLEYSANGMISYSFPAVHGGRLADNVKLWFKKGKIVKTYASKGKDFLNSMLESDKGARRIGEFAFGTNYGIKDYTKNTLFDEKIGGTIHIAIGSGYPETGSKNKSAIHWDMVCDLRKKGEVYADNELIFKNGKFII